MFSHSQISGCHRRQGAPISFLLIGVLLMLLAIPEFSQGKPATITITGTDVAPILTPGITAPIIRLRFTSITGNPKLSSIAVTRTGSATDVDIPTVALYEDTNQDGTPDGDAITTGSFSGGSATLPDLGSTSPSTTIDWLIIYTISPTANVASNTGGQITQSDISVLGNPTLTFAGIVTGDHSLPVKLYDFAATIVEDKIRLQWTTASEINNAFFVVERADQDPRHFSAIAQIPGQGNSTSNTRYEFIDDRIIPGMSYCYRLTDTNFDGNQFQHESIQIQYVTDYLPTEVHLLQNFPNPFNLSTFISYELPTESAVEISVFDLGGKLIKTLVDGVESPGLKTVRWDGRDDTGQIVSSGTYYFRMNANGTAKYGRALLLK